MGRQACSCGLDQQIPCALGDLAGEGDDLGIERLVLTQGQVHPGVLDGEPGGRGGGARPGQVDRFLQQRLGLIYPTCGDLGLGKNEQRAGDDGRARRNAAIDIESFERAFPGGDVFPKVLMGGGERGQNRGPSLGAGDLLAEIGKRLLGNLSRLRAKVQALAGAPIVETVRGQGFVIRGEPSV